MSALPFEERVRTIAPVITKHLGDLRMDTPADTRLLDMIRIQWKWALDGDDEAMVEAVKPYGIKRGTFGQQSDTPVSQQTTHNEEGS